MIARDRSLIRYYPFSSDPRELQVDVISALDGYDRSDDPISALADQIADRLAVRLGMRLMELAAAAEPDPRGLWTARHVAAHYDVGVRFVYQHADELGCIRLGGGRCAAASLRPAHRPRALAAVGGALPAERRPAGGVPSNVQRTAHRRARRTYELLEFDQEP